MSGCPEHWIIQSQTLIRAKLHHVITMHARPRQTDGETDRRTNIMAIALRFVVTNASRAKDCVKASGVVGSLVIVLLQIFS